MQAALLWAPMRMEFGAISTPAAARTFLYNTHQPAKRKKVDQPETEKKALLLEQTTLVWGEEIGYSLILFFKVSSIC